ncbi:MAG: sugar-binding protein [Armatimonadota bacterium]
MTRFNLLLLALFSCAVLARAEFVPTPTQHLILKPKTPIVIDGKLAEWDMASTPVVINPEDTKNPLIKAFIDPSNPVKGAADVSGRVAMAWDDKYLYFAGAVVDDHLLGVKPDSLGNEGPAPWGCDSVMVNMNSYRTPMTRNNPYSTDVTLGLRYAPMGANPRGKLIPNTQVLNAKDMHWKITKNAKWAVTETPNGYNVEVALPWADIGYTPRIGERLFIAFMLPDMDPDEPLVQVGWGMVGSGMKSYPVFRLSERTDALGAITTSTDEVSTNAAWSVRTEVDARTGAARLDKLRILDATGKVVLERPVGMDTPKGMTGIDLRQFKPGEIAKPGRYSVEAVLATTAGPVVIARQPLRVTEPAPEPPMVTNPAGELHHMRPSRIAHSTLDLHARGLIKHNFVKGKDDYIPFIKKYVEPGFIDTVRGQITGNSPWGFAYLLQTLALYKLTGDEAYVKLGRDLMNYEITRATKDTSLISHWNIMPYAAFRYYTWLQDPKSPFTPPDAEKRYRAMFYPIAANPSTDFFSESGTHNRIWARYCILKAARMFAEQDGKPVDPRVVAYTDFHQKILEDMGDDDDASSGYNWGWFHFPLSIYYHQGSLEPLKTNRGYRKVMTRYAETISPSGAMPTFGADSGWPSLGQSIWTFELMAALTRNGMFRWQAHRVAEYIYNHLYHDVTQYHLPADTMKNLFLMGYFFADDSLTPTPPPGNSRLTWRHPMVPVPAEVQKEHPGMGMIMVPEGWIPDKLILATGNDPRGIWGLVELLPFGGHGGSLPGNLITLLQHDSVLLAGQGYYEQSPPYQNILWIEDLDGLAANPQPVTTEVPILTDDAAYTYARVKTSAYQELPVTYTRDILFYKGGFVVVKDRAKFDSTMKVRLGPCWQTRDIGPQAGDNWFNTYYEEMYVTGLGLGRGVQSFLTPPWDLLIYFSPRPGRKHTINDTYAENPYRQSPIRMRQEWAGMTSPGQEITFTSVLLPHYPMLSPKDLLQPPAEAKTTPNIEVVQDDEKLTVVKVVTESDPNNRIRSVHWVMFNSTGGLAKAGPLESDALVAVVRTGADEKTITDRAMTGGTMLRFLGKDESAAARKTNPTPPVLPAYLK